MKAIYIKKEDVAEYMKILSDIVKDTPHIAYVEDIGNKVRMLYKKDLIGKTKLTDVEKVLYERVYEKKKVSGFIKYVSSTGLKEKNGQGTWYYIVDTNRVKEGLVKGVEDFIVETVTKIPKELVRDDKDKEVCTEFIIEVIKYLQKSNGKLNDVLSNIVSELRKQMERTSGLLFSVMLGVESWLGLANVFKIDIKINTRRIISEIDKAWR